MNCVLMYMYPAVILFCLYMCSVVSSNYWTVHNTKVKYGRAVSLCPRLLLPMCHSSNLSMYSSVGSQQVLLLVSTHCKWQENDYYTSNMIYGSTDLFPSVSASLPLVAGMSRPSQPLALALTALCREKEVTD